MQYLLPVVPVFSAPHYYVFHACCLGETKAILQAGRIHRFILDFKAGVWYGLAVRRPCFGLHLCYDHIAMVKYLLDASQKGVVPGRKWIFKVAVRDVSIPDSFVDGDTKKIRLWFANREAYSVITAADNGNVARVEFFN